MDPIYHRKTICNEDAQHELKILNKIDKIDPSCLYHVGHAIIESSNRENTTIRFPYGGITMNKISQENMQNIRRVMTNLGTLLEGLSIVNKEGIYHLDVKVTNIVYTQTDFQPKLIDFGISKTVLGGINDIFANIYSVWPFEVHLLSGETDIFSTHIYGEYVNDDYLLPIFQIFQIDPTDIKFNIIRLRRYIRTDNTVRSLSEIIHSGIDIYSFGVMLGHLLLNQKVVSVLSTDEFSALIALGKSMTEPYTLERISLAAAAIKYHEVFQD